MPTVSCSREAKLPRPVPRAPLPLSGRPIPGGDDASATAPGSTSSTRWSYRSFCGWNQTNVATARAANGPPISQGHLRRRSRRRPQRGPDLVAGSSGRPGTSSARVMTGVLRCILRGHGREHGVRRAGCRAGRRTVRRPEGCRPRKRRAPRRPRTDARTRIRTWSASASSWRQTPELQFQTTTSAASVPRSQNRATSTAPCSRRASSRSREPLLVLRDMTRAPDLSGVRSPSPGAAVHRRDRRSAGVGPFPLYVGAPSPGLHGRADELPARAGSRGSPARRRPNAGVRAPASRRRRRWPPVKRPRSFSDSRCTSSPAGGERGGRRD